MQLLTIHSIVAKNIKGSNQGIFLRKRLLRIVLLPLTRDFRRKLVNELSKKVNICSFSWAKRGCV